MAYTVSEIRLALAPTRLQKVSEILGADINQCLEEIERRARLSAAVDQFWARSAVRSFLAWVEATTFEMKLVVEAAATVDVIQLSVGERAVLSQQSYELDSRKLEPVARPRYVPTDRFLRFAFKLFARTFQINTALNISDAGWQDFQVVLKVRHRITHPKGPDSLEVTSDELQALTRAMLWYVVEQQRLIRLIRSQLEDPQFLSFLGSKRREDNRVADDDPTGRSAIDLVSH